MAHFIRNIAHHLPESMKNCIVRAGLMSGFLSNKDLITTPDGQIFDVPQTMHPVDARALSKGLYEEDEIALLRESFLEEQGTIIEVGANIGVVARYAMGHKLNVGGTYICVEPNPNSFPALQTNMKRAEQQYPGRHVQTVQAAIGNTANGTEADFYVRRNLSSGLAGLVKPKRSDQTIKTNIISLSHLITQSPSSSISLICDAEGGEIPIIQDSEALTKIRQIAVELHEPKLTGSDITPAMMVDCLQQQGFSLGRQVKDSYYFSRILQ